MEDLTPEKASQRVQREKESLSQQRSKINTYAGLEANSEEATVPALQIQEEEECRGVSWGMPKASRSFRRHRNRFSPRASRRNTALFTPRFSSLRLLSPELQTWKRSDSCLKPLRWWEFALAVAGN